jgi:hypothetical protein
MRHHLLDKIKEIESEWKVSLVKNSLLMVCLLLEEKTCNLWKLKGSVGKLLGNHQSDPRSHYQRIKRWLWSGARNKGIWIEMLLAIGCLMRGKTKILMLDGTSWQAGGRTYHFLTLSVLYQGVSIPLFWLDMGRLGISRQWHRKKLLTIALGLFDLAGKVLLADREYIGSDWFKALTRAGLDFVIRLRDNTYQAHINLGSKSVEKLERKAKARIGRIVWQEFFIGEESYLFVMVAYRTRKGNVDILRLATTLSPAMAVKNYGYRYRIETMFRHLKSNGFDMESLHVEKAYKVNMLVAAMALAYALSVVYGLASYKRKVAFKKHLSAEMSVFRWGLDKWQNHLQTFEHFLDALLQYVKQWIRPQNNLFYVYVP